MLVFRILTLSEDQSYIVDSVNLRLGTRANLNVNCIDVAWHSNDSTRRLSPLSHVTSDCSNEIVTAAANGKVVLWDLTRPHNKQKAVSPAPI